MNTPYSCNQSFFAFDRCVLSSAKILTSLRFFIDLSAGDHFWAKTRMSTRSILVQQWQLVAWPSTGPTLTCQDWSIIGPMLAQCMALFWSNVGICNACYAMAADVQPWHTNTTAVILCRFLPSWQYYLGYWLVPSTLNSRALCKSIF